MAKDNTRAQWLADEVGTIRKDPGGKLRVALCYPNSYAVGMSNLGFQTLYRLLNADPRVVCERAFLTDGATPPRTLESDRPLGEMDVIAFSVSFEMDYPHIARMLHLAGVPLFAAERAGPLVIAGGATLAYNPEPIAPFLDAAVIGEADLMVPALVDALTAEGDVLEALAAIPGVYLPARGPLPVVRLLIPHLDDAPVYTQVFTPHTEFGEMGLLQVGRGCPYGCRFCVASHVFRPLRWCSLAGLERSLDRLLPYRRRIGLIAASVTDFPEIMPLCEMILSRGGEPAPASMRADALTPELLALLARGHVRTVTLAPEAGTVALRRQVGKHLSDEAVLAAAVRIAQAGIHQLKLYFIVGLPGETAEDVAAIPALARRVAAASGLRVSVGCSALVPKPGTPFARQPMAAEADLKRKFATIRRALRGDIHFTHESPRWAFWQAALARGGRELAPALALIAEQPDALPVWQEAFRTRGLDAAVSVLQPIPPDAPLPWAHIGATGCELTAEKPAP